MLRQRFLGAIAVAITCLDAVLATASPPSISVLEQQALAEFSKAGDAVRERLAREAAGDLIGARIAARDGDTHRYRFLDIQRELRRLHSRAAPTPSVAASRSPFSPDFAVFSAPVTAAASRRLVTPDRRATETTETEYPLWDMYRPRAPRVVATVDDSARQNPGPRGADMYRNPRVQSPLSEQNGPGGDRSSTLSLREEPSKPFLVYRERIAQTHGTH